MANSIFLLIVIAAGILSAWSILVNIRRIEELQSLKRSLNRFEKAFYNFNEWAIRKDKEDHLVELIVKDETKKDDQPLKFGDE